ncbi:hypothetical protein CLG96_11265 [Sphingomonas oleivorans]|uniref:PEP-CTERM protein-sorting domain-containing protein n=1 Tax=Sphingomonas oleivorans TaxID=1735121 RepID=A0A2T5FXT3_9SPHN|nr:hypothetical protein [Sphingomonas oleivorans]PTQ10948.1 hypothetical protein CLG96_11265 [Sphingomonas oleivorans]
MRIGLVVAAILAMIVPAAASAEQVRIKFDGNFADGSLYPTGMKVSGTLSYDRDALPFYVYETNPGLGVALFDDAEIHFGIGSRRFAQYSYYGDLVGDDGSDEFLQFSTGFVDRAIPSHKLFFYLDFEANGADLIHDLRYPGATELLSFSALARAEADDLGQSSIAPLTFSITPPAPEPEGWATMTAGLSLAGFAARRGKGRLFGRARAAA